MSRLLLFVVAVTLMLGFGFEWGDQAQEASYGYLRDRVNPQGHEAPLIVFFGRENCGKCLNMTRSLDGLLAEYPGATVGFFDLDNDNDQDLLRLLLAHYAPGGIRTLYPVIFIGETVIVGDGRMRELELRIAVEDCLAKGCSSPLDRVDVNASDNQWGRPSPTRVSSFVAM